MLAFGWGCGRGSGWPAGGLVVAVGVEGELAEEFCGGGVGDADVKIAHRQRGVGSGVGPAGACGRALAGVAEGEGAGGAGDVGADAVVGAGGAVAGDGRGPGGVGGGGGGAAGRGPVRPLVVVVAGGLVELGLPARSAAAGRAAGHFLRVCWNLSALP